jgi:DNA primase large subunit
MDVERPMRVLENILVDVTNEEIDRSIGEMVMEEPMGEMMMEESMGYEVEETITRQLNNLLEDLAERDYQENGGRVVQMYPDESPRESR